jgi:ecotin
MRNTLTHVLIAGLVVLSVSAFGAEHPALKAFPAAKEGMERFVIVLPEKERGEEDSFRVEIIVGKDMLTDGVNLV